MFRQFDYNKLISLNLSMRENDRNVKFGKKIGRLYLACHKHACNTRKIFVSPKGIKSFITHIGSRLLPLNYGGKSG